MPWYGGQPGGCCGAPYGSWHHQDDLYEYQLALYYWSLHTSMILSCAGCNSCRPMFVPGYPCGPAGGPGYPGIPGFCGDHYGCCGGDHHHHGHCGHGGDLAHGCGCQNPAYMNTSFGCGPGCVGGYQSFAMSC